MRTFHSSSSFALEFWVSINHRLGWLHPRVPSCKPINMQVKSMPSSCTNFLPSHEEWIPALYIYSLEEKTTYQKNNYINGTNFCKKTFPGTKSRSMCWTYQTHMWELLHQRYSNRPSCLRLQDEGFVKEHFGKTSCRYNC
jgi:hypothetical protein